MKPSKELVAAAAAKGLRLDPSDTPGRFYLKSASGNFVVDGVDLSPAELSERLHDARAAISEMDDPIGRLKIQHRMVRNAAYGALHDPHGDDADRSLAAIHDAMLDVESMLDEVHRLWLKAHAGLGGKD